MARINSHRRAVDPEGGGGLAAQITGEALAVEGGDIAVILGERRRADAPRAMSDEVFLGAAAGQGGVAPVVFSDVLFVRARIGAQGEAGGFDGDATPLAAEFPPVLDALGRFAVVVAVDLMVHRHAEVILAVKNAGGQRDGALRR